MFLGSWHHSTCHNECRHGCQTSSANTGIGHKLSSMHFSKPGWEICRKSFPRFQSPYTTSCKCVGSLNGNALIHIHIIPPPDHGTPAHRAQRTPLPGYTRTTWLTIIVRDFVAQCKSVFHGNHFYKHWVVIIAWKIIKKILFKLLHQFHHHKRIII